MAQVYKSKVSGELGILDDYGQFAWVTRKEAQDCLRASAGTPYEVADGEPMTDDDPLWDDLQSVERITNG